MLSDLDGVLVDSGAVIEATWRRFAGRHGLDAEHVLAESHGRRTVDVIRLVAPHLDPRPKVAGSSGTRLRAPTASGQTMP